MSILKYPKLFEPFAIRNVTFRNRIFAAPQGYYNVGADNLPTLAEIAFFERKAIGGAASVSVGDCIVDELTGTHYPYLTQMDDPNTMPGLSMLASAITRNGAVASAELSHAGMFARYVKATGGKLYGPVDMQDGKYGEVEAMTEEMILYIADKFGQAAAWAKTCGFNMVTVHAGHGWLLAQFLSPLINNRKDRWGGSFENRMRFTLAAIESVRKYVGAGFPIELRMSGSEYSDKGYDLEEGVKIAKALDGKVDILHISAGHHEIDEAFIITHPSMFLEDGVNVKYAAEIKKHVKTPVATVGALTNPQMMEEIIASGKADIVQLGRQSIADPDLPIKARLGMDDDIDNCMRCSACFASIGAHRYPQCALNPTIGRELEEKNDIPARAPKRVLVAGGGIGGMQAALTAAKQGHEVILCEKTDKLGGILRCESSVPFKAKLEKYLDRQALRISRAPIDLRLNTTVTPELAKEIAPDAIIAALGARPIKPAIPGIDCNIVIGAEDLYYNPDEAGERLVIIGGGLVGIELGVFMARRGKQVTIIEVMDKLSTDLGGLHSAALKSEIERLNIAIHLNTTVKEITNRGIICENADGQVEFPADTVIYATGQRPLREDAFALSNCAPEFWQIGDCSSPRNIMDANQEAYTAARSIGRLG